MDDKINILNERLINNASRTEMFRDRKIVTGEGNTHARIILIGEAPGREEEKLGRPFVGAAGKNLNEFLDILKISRDEIYITNTVKVRPFRLSEKTGKPVNRPPSVEELDFFIPYLLEEIQIIAPMYVVTLGNVALKAVAGKNAVIGSMHGNKTALDDTMLFPLYHPASVIYNRGLRDVYINDLHRFAELLLEVI